MSYKVAIGGDHAGYSYKNVLKEVLAELGHEVQDFGPDSDASADYPDHVHPLAQAVEAKKFDFGVLVCGSGNGVAITANKYPQIRAALCWQTALAKLAREHNDANIICIPARFLSVEEAVDMMKVFLSTDFMGGRHAERVRKITGC
ncbi:ribose 5-phosphate isomerase B [Botryobacter ruber]|uniref:ribose 5-phosphate isomerase B n=1 Tax=Botryobacter ruber TaxID=2171629 RepID=UPI001478AF0B|nr:ribose 5-phosphate isomerase B [Botryobacter ruber]